MSETEQSSTGPGPEKGPDTSGLAIDAALGEARNEPSLKEDVAAFFRDQRALIADQREHMHAQFAPHLRQLHLGVWEKRLGVLLRVATAFIGLAVAAGFAFLIWNAAHSNELIVDAFSVPPDLEQKGINGEVLAGQLVDRLLHMQANTTSFRAPQSYTSSLGESIKLEIPETGISFAELDRFLREKLGNNTHISGALIRAASGLKLTARAGAQGSDSVEGAENDLDALVQRMAEAIYSRTQPFRYGTYIWGQGRSNEANILFRNLARTGSPSERAWALISLGSTTADAAGNSASDEAVNTNFRIAKRATELEPGIALAWAAVSDSGELLGRSEDVLFAARRSLALSSGPDRGHIRADYVVSFMEVSQARVDAALGDFAAAAKGQINAAQSGRTGMTVGSSAKASIYQARGHDISAAQITMADPAPDPVARADLSARHVSRAKIVIAASKQDWEGVLREAVSKDSRFPEMRANYFASEESYIAIAEAKLGRFTQAEARIGKAPGDCYPCLIARAQIAEMQGQHARADWWFERATKEGPSIPFAFFDWGNALMQRGDLKDAIAKFRIANQKGPHFADPLEMWGEVLMAQNRSDLAIAKFREAERYAPNWGRLHLKWGEALSYLGKTAEAQKQFARAAELDLTAAEKTELARVRFGG